MNISPVEPGPSDPKDQRAIQSVEVGSRLLLALAAHPGPLTLKDVAQGANLSPSRAHPYLVSYCRLGMVSQDPESGRYRLGPAALQLGLAALNQLEPVQEALPIAHKLAQTTQQTVLIAVWANFGPTVVRLIESPLPLHVNLRLGTVMSIWDTATGQVFAAFQPANQLSRLIPANPVAPSPALSSTQQEAIQQFQSQLKTHGVTQAAGHPIPSIYAFAAPAINHTGDLALVITALGHESQLYQGWQSPMAQAVRQAGQDISRRLGFTASGSLIPETPSSLTGPTPSAQ